MDCTFAQKTLTNNSQASNQDNRALESNRRLEEEAQVLNISQLNGGTREEQGVYAKDTSGLSVLRKKA